MAKKLLQEHCRVLEHRYDIKRTVMVVSDQSPIGQMFAGGVTSVVVNMSSGDTKTYYRIHKDTNQEDIDRLYLE